MAPPEATAENTPESPEDGSDDESSGNEGLSIKSSKKNQWTPEEDSVLLALVQKYGARKWSQIASQLPARLGRQCNQESMEFLCSQDAEEGTKDPEAVLG